MCNLRSLIPRRDFLARCAALPLFGTLFGSLVGKPRSLLADEPSLEELLAKYKEPPADELAAEVERLLKLIPEELRYRPEPVAPEENAWPVWQEAIKAEVAERWDEEFDAAHEKLWTEPNAVSRRARRRVEARVEANQKCLELIDEGIARGKFLTPRKPNSMDLDSESLIGLRSLAQLKQSRCQLQLVGGASDKALDSASSIVDMGEIALRGATSLVEYMFAVGIIGIGGESVQRVAMAPASDRAIARKAIDRLAAIHLGAENLKQFYRGELCNWFVPWLARLPEKAEALELAVQQYRPLIEMGKGLQGWQERYERTMHQTVKLIAEHPNPLDRSAALRLFCDLHIQQFAEVDKPFSERNRHVLGPLENELRDWPPEVTANDVLPIVGDGVRHKLTDEDLQIANKRLRRVHNVLGKRLILDSASMVWDRPLFERHQAMREVKRIRIAMHCYQKEHHRLADRLEDLVEEKLLPSVPIDPMDGQPFRYSAERRVIWSVGEDGKNSGEIPEKDDPSEPFDEDYQMTWRISAAG